MVNSMNVRHNNCGAADKKKYNAKFATLTSQEQEDWYDEIYQGLMAFLMLEQANREKKLLRSKVPLHHRYMDNIIHLGKLELNLEDREMKSVDNKSLLGTLNTFE